MDGVVMDRFQITADVEENCTSGLFLGGLYCLMGWRGFDEDLYSSPGKEVWPFSSSSTWLLLLLWLGCCLV